MKKTLTTKKKTETPKVKKTASVAKTKSVGKKTAKKAAIKKKPVAKAKKVAKKIEIPAPEIAKVESVQPETPEIKITHAKANIVLREEGATQLRAAAISQISRNLSHLRVGYANAEEKFNIANHIGGDKQRRAESFERMQDLAKEIREIESRVTRVRQISIADFVHQTALIPSSVKTRGETTEDIKARAAASIGFLPSKARFIKSVELVG